MLVSVDTLLVYWGTHEIRGPPKPSGPWEQDGMTLPFAGKEGLHPLFLLFHQFRA